MLNKNGFPRNRKLVTLRLFSIEKFSCTKRKTSYLKGKSYCSAKSKFDY